MQPANYVENDKQLEKEGLLIRFFLQLKERKRRPSHNDLVSKRGHENGVEGLQRRVIFQFVCSLFLLIFMSKM